MRGITYTKHMPPLDELLEHRGRDVRDANRGHLLALRHARLSGGISAALMLGVGAGTEHRVLVVLPLLVLGEELPAPTCIARVI